MLPVKATVIKAQAENARVNRLTLDISLQYAAPGQFVMAWAPGLDEKPMSISENAEHLEITVCKAGGPASAKISESKVGDELFIRGPLGHGFELTGKSWLAVGGGYGFAPLRYLARVGMESGRKVDAIIGARTKDALIGKAACPTTITTDDGSAGKKGNAVEALQEALIAQKYDMVFSCGPEKMMAAVARTCKDSKVPCQLLIERYMKCGFGVCGHCAMGKWLACVDGPAIYGEEALKNPEFGLTHKDKTGCKCEW